MVVDLSGARSHHENRFVARGSANSTWTWCRVLQGSSTMPRHAAVDNIKGVNAHHQAETAFKAFGRALRMAVEVDGPSPASCPRQKQSLS